jgi:hypothetical protein
MTGDVLFGVGLLLVAGTYGSSVVTKGVPAAAAPSAVAAPIAVAALAPIVPARDRPRPPEDQLNWEKAMDDNFEKFIDAGHLWYWGHSGTTYTSLKDHDGSFLAKKEVKDRAVKDLKNSFAEYGRLTCLRNIEDWTGVASLEDKTGRIHMYISSGNFAPSTLRTDAYGRPDGASWLVYLEGKVKEGSEIYQKIGRSVSGLLVKFSGKSTGCPKIVSSKYQNLSSMPNSPVKWDDRTLAFTFTKIEPL